MPELSHNPNPSELYHAYCDGLPGWQYNQGEWDKFRSGMPDNSFSELGFHLMGTGKGKRALLWRSRYKYDPGAFTQESQTTGDCVSHGDRSAYDTTRSVEIHIKGEPESYFKRGATEPTYGARGHSGQGMDPTRAARFVRDYGWLVRQDYGFVNLSVYNSSIGAAWGRRGVPDKVKEECKKHNVGDLTFPDSVDDCIDLMANGYAGHSGQNIGFSRTANSNGIFDVSGRWNHDMATVGYDDTKEIYPVCVFFVVNSWGAWNNKPRVWPEDILGPWIPGMIVVSENVYARFVSARSMIYYSNVKGFPSQKLPDWGFSSYL